MLRESSTMTGLTGSVMKRANEDTDSGPPTKKSRSQPKTITLKAPDDMLQKTNFELRYPILAEIQRSWKENSLDDNEKLEIYTNYMNSGLTCGIAHQNQYGYIDALHEIFENGHLNSVSGARASPMCVWRTAGVEPHQDMIVQQFFAMAEETGVSHLSVEFYMFLIANIIGFTTKNNKTAMVIVGPTSSGKSYATNAAALIARGTGVCENTDAFEDEDYSFIKSITASRVPYGYEKVSGTVFVDEWRGGNKNKSYKDGSLLTANLKTVWDYGACKREKCVKKRGGGFVAVRDVALYDKTMIMLASEFHVGDSLTKRMLIYHVPEYKSVGSRKHDFETRSILHDKRLTHLFSFMRFQISEAMNRRAIGFRIEGSDSDSDEDLDVYETELTFSRMDQVLCEMGYKRMLTSRVIEQIRYFAEVFCRWRAVMEVYGYSHHKRTEASFSDQLRQDKENLGGFSDGELAKMVEKRSVLDPSDLLSAATMVLEFSDHSRRAKKESTIKTFIRKTLCKNMTDMSTILVFDREKCHNTQNREDAFFFQENCTDEEFWTDLDYIGETYMAFNRVKQPWSRLVSYVAGHRYNKLAYKELLSAGKVQELRQQCDPMQFKKELREAVYLEAKEMASGDNFVPLQIIGPLLPYPDSMIARK